MSSSPTEGGSSTCRESPVKEVIESALALPSVLHLVGTSRNAAAVKSGSYREQ